MKITVKTHPPKENVDFPVLALHTGPSAESSMAGTIALFTDRQTAIIMQTNPEQVDNRVGDRITSHPDLPCWTVFEGSITIQN